MIEQSISYEFWTERVWSYFQFSFFFFTVLVYLAPLMVHWHFHISATLMLHQTNSYILSHLLIYSSSFQPIFHLCDGVCTIPRIPYVTLSFHHESLKLKKVEQIKKTFFLKLLPRNLPINAHFSPSHGNWFLYDWEHWALMGSWTLCFFGCYFHKPYFGHFLTH